MFYRCGFWSYLVHNPNTKQACCCCPTRSSPPDPSAISPPHHPTPTPTPPPHQPRYAPILAGSAVGRKASSRKTVKARGQFQIFDTNAGWVSNQARFSLLGRAGLIQVDGPARVEGSEDGTRVVATFTAAELKWGDVVRWVCGRLGGLILRLAAWCVIVGRSLARACEPCPPHPPSTPDTPKPVINTQDSVPDSRLFSHRLHRHPVPRRRPAD